MQVLLDASFGWLILYGHIAPWPGPDSGQHGLKYTYDLPESIFMPIPLAKYLTRSELLSSTFLSFIIFTYSFIYTVLKYNYTKSYQ